MVYDYIFIFICFFKLEIVRKRSRQLKKGLALFFIFVGCFVPLSLPAQMLRNQTLAAMGVTTIIPQQNGIFVQQSIGQSSVTGTYGASSLRLSQGFLRGGIALSKEIKPSFSVIVFPNAFTDQLRFRFADDHKEETLLQVIDMQGRLVYETTREPVNKEIEISLPFLATGVYLVQLRSGDKFVQTRIIKKPWESFF